MASSFITKDGIHGFWVKDSLMQVVCWGIVNVIDRLADQKDSWVKNEFREHVFNNSQGIFVGFMHLSIEDFFVTRQQEDLLTEIIEKTGRFFQDKGKCISIDELNNFQLLQNTKSVWLLPLETERVMRILEFLSNVVNDRISIRAGDEIDYSF